MFKNQIKKYMPISLWKSLGNTKLSIISLKTNILLKLGKSDFKFLNFVIRNRSKKIIWMDSLPPDFVFVDSENINVYKPKYLEPQRFLNVQKPQICLYEFKNAKVHNESSHILLKNSVIMERLPHISLKNCNYSTGFIIGHDDTISLVKNFDNIVNVDKAFFLGGNGSWNYYHWSIEIIVKLKYFLSIESIDKSMKIILPDYAKNIPSFSSMLEILIGDRFPLIYICNNQLAQVERLYVINTPSNIVFNSRNNFILDADASYFDKNSIDFLRNKVISSTQYKKSLENSKIKFKSKKIFLARKENSLRNYNQIEVIDLVKKFGFSPIFLEELSFLEQIYVFQNSDFIIGASGAAWTNLIYVKKGMKAISWLGNNSHSFPSYSTLASYYGCNLTFFKCNVFNQEDLHSNYSVNLDILEGLIKKITS